jgi:hypothetical protein
LRIEEFRVRELELKLMSISLSLDANAIRLVDEEAEIRHKNIVKL